MLLQAVCVNGEESQIGAAIAKDASALGKQQVMQVLLADKPRIAEKATNLAAEMLANTANPAFADWCERFFKQRNRQEPIAMPA